MPTNPKTIEADNPGKSNVDTVRENVRFIREDWTRLRTVNGLQQQAGVPAELLRRLVNKELADNALDEGSVSVGQMPDGRYFVEDDGRGFDGTPQDIAHMFSINRPLTSTKLWRKPSRGAQGNGLRVVAGAVFASNGSLVVTTRGRRIELRPLHDGTTSVVSVTPVKNQAGTRIEIGFGPAVPEDEDALFWANVAIRMNCGGTYAGKSSPWWYDASEFHDLLLASNATVREMVLNLEGCARNVGEIVAEARLIRAAAAAVTRAQSDKLLTIARRDAKPVTANRLGSIGAGLFPNHAYTKTSGEVSFGTGPLVAAVPFVLEVWAKEQASMTLTVAVNRTPVSGNIHAEHNKRDIDFFGCGLQYAVATAPQDKDFGIWMNIVTPFIASTSNSKEPNLKPFLNAIREAVQKAVKHATRKDTSQGDSLLPKKRRGRQSDAATIEYDERIASFCRLILQIKSEMDFAVGSRGWCYILERHGLRKGEFVDAEKLITACRKSGALPLDICAEDEARKAVGLQQIDSETIEDKAEQWIAFINNAHKTYTPTSFLGRSKILRRSGRRKTRSAKSVRSRVRGVLRSDPEFQGLE